MGLFSGSVSSTYEFPSLGQSHSFWKQCLPSLCGQCRMWWRLPWQDVITIKWYKIFQLPSVCLSIPHAIIPQGGKYRIGIRGWEWDSGAFSHFVWLVIVYTFSLLLIGPFLGLLVREESFLLTFFVYSHCSFWVVTFYSPQLGIFEAWRKPRGLTAILWIKSHRV